MDEKPDNNEWKPSATFDIVSGIIVFLLIWLLCVISMFGGGGGKIHTPWGTVG